VFGNLNGVGLYIGGNAYFEGIVNATGGKIAGWDINSNSINAGDVYLENTNSFKGLSINDFYANKMVRVGRFDVNSLPNTYKILYGYYNQNNLLFTDNWEQIPSWNINGLFNISDYKFIQVRVNEETDNLARAAKKTTNVSLYKGGFLSFTFRFFATGSNRPPMTIKIYGDNNLLYLSTMNNPLEEVINVKIYNTYTNIIIEGYIGAIGVGGFTAEVGDYGIVLAAVEVFYNHIFLSDNYCSIGVGDKRFEISNSNNKITANSIEIINDLYRWENNAIGKYKWELYTNNNKQLIARLKNADGNTIKEIILAQ